MDEISRSLDKVAAAMIKGATQGTRLAGKHIQGEAKKLVPAAERYGGKLRKSILEKGVMAHSS